MTHFISTRTCSVVAFSFTLLAAAGAFAGGDVVGVGAGAISNPNTPPHYGQSSPPAGFNFVSVSAGDGHSLGLRSDGSVTGWGRNTEGQCLVPTGAFSAASAGGFFSLGLRADGSVVGWGSNGSGQLNVPAGTYIQVSAGEAHAAGVKVGGSVVAWGANSWGQTAAQTGTFLQVAAGGHHTLGLRTNGSLKGWGNNARGQTTVPTGSNFTQVRAGFEHSGALRADGSVVCWGLNGNGQCNAPTGSFTDLSTGRYHTVALRSDGTAVAFGAGQAPPFVDPNYGQSMIPSAGDGRAFRAVAAGGYHSLLVRVNDCNENGVDDSIDIASGLAQDCDSNGIPDSCDLDTDADGAIDACEECDGDPLKTTPGICGCGVADTESDSDGTADCKDG